MGILPLQFADGDSLASLGLTGEETIDIVGLDTFRSGEVPKEITVRAGARRVQRPGPDRHPHGGRVLPARGHTPLRPAAARSLSQSPTAAEILVASAAAASVRVSASHCGKAVSESTTPVAMVTVQSGWSSVTSRPDAPGPLAALVVPGRHRGCGPASWNSGE